jgi:DHA1 family bicyclomycin/chloramphenicol resistance-like MFS transporter
MQTTLRLPMLTLLMLISFGSICATLFTPGLPTITTYFHVSQSFAQLTVTLYLMGYALGQLIYGPLANRFGRKKAIYVGIGSEIVAALLCALSSPLHNITLLLIARFIMALGASTGVTMTFTLIADVYAQQQAAKIVSYLILAFAIMPGIGMSIGGFLVENFQWEYCFYVLALYGVLLGISMVWMPETAKSLDKQATQTTVLIKNYLHQLRDKRLMLSATILGLNTTYIYLFVVLAPFVAIELLHLHPDQYGVWNLLPATGMLVGAFLSAKLSEHLSSLLIIYSGIVMTVASVMLLFAALAIFPNKYSLFLPMFLVYIGLTTILPHVSTLATSHANDKSNASAVMNFTNLSVSGMIVSLTVIFSSHSLLLLPMMYLGLLVLQIIFFIMLNRHHSGLQHC